MRVTQNFLLIFLTIFVKETYSLCDKFALSTVDALVHKQKNARVIVQRAENFNTLDDYISVDVIKSNVSQLCEGMIKNFPKLETLSFINANLSLIEPGTFQNVPKLKYLSLSVNQLVNIPRGAFNTITSLKVIYLTSNQIETIEDAAFSQMANLKAVHLDHNKITELSGNIFFGSPMISFVDFSYNQLTTIQKSAFDDLRPGSNVRILNLILKRNQINNFDVEALKQLIPVNLHLESNEIIRVSEIVFSAKEGSNIYLNNNKIECIPDDVLDLIKSSDITVDVKNNPVSCECVAKVDDILSGDVRGELNVITTIRCNANFYGNQLF